MTHKHCEDTRKLLENLDFNENPPFSGQKVTHKHCGTFMKVSSKLLHSNFSLVKIKSFWWIFDFSEIFGPLRYFPELLSMYKIIYINPYLLIVLGHIVRFHLFFQTLRIIFNWDISIRIILITSSSIIGNVSGINWYLWIVRYPIFWLGSSVEIGLFGLCNY